MARKASAVPVITDHGYSVGDRVYVAETDRWIPAEVINIETVGSVPEVCSTL